MKGKSNTFKIPNSLITDQRLHYSARRLGAVLYAHRNALGFVTKSLDALARLADCDISTVRSSLEELCEAGYAEVHKNYIYSAEHNRLVYGKTSYAVNLRFSGSFTMMTRNIFRNKLHHSAFCVYMYIALCAGGKKRSFPSAAKIADGLGMSKASVHRAVKALSGIRYLLVNHCLKSNRSFANNTYYLVTEAFAAQKQSGSPTCKAPPKPKLSAFLHYYCITAKNALQAFFGGFLSGGSLKIRKLSWYLDNDKTKKGRKRLNV